MIAHEASFRDPSGYIYTENSTIKRVITPLYFKQYHALTSEGFYQKLIDNTLLIPHKEELNTSDKIIIKPTEIPFITYPYEWSFLQYQHAALLTLKIQRFCLQHHFTLKDASAYNIAFYKGSPIFIDTLSFDFYKDGMPWNAYKQFITHFLAPLVLATYHGASVLRTMSNYLDGIPMQLTASLLPYTTRFHPFLYPHIHLLARYEAKYQEKTAAQVTIKKISKKAQLKIIDSLYYYIRKLKLSDTTQWDDYYGKTNYNKAAFAKKETLVKAWASTINADTILDLGGNNGRFARTLSPKGTILVADADPLAVDDNYSKIVRDGEKHLIALVCDILNPAPAIGFNNTERFSFLHRLKHFKPGLCLALALIHHITLSGNIPFSRSASFFASFSPYLLIEFPSENDTQVQFLRHRKDGHEMYSVDDFEQAYTKKFSIVQQKKIPYTHRILYLLKNKAIPS